MIFQQYPHKHPSPHPAVSWYQQLYWQNAYLRLCSFSVRLSVVRQPLQQVNQEIHIHIKTKRPREMSSHRLDELHHFSNIYLCSQQLHKFTPNGNCPVATGQLVFHIGQGHPKLLKNPNCSAQLAHIALSERSALYF